MESLEQKVGQIKKILGTNLFPIGIKIVQNGFGKWDESFRDVSSNKRFCYFVSRAARGETFVITNSSELDCFHPFVALGFDEPTNADIQPRISPAITKAVLIGPLHKFKTPVDTILFIVNPNQAMFLTTAYRRISRENIKASFGAAMAVCGEAVAHTVKYKTPNISFLCGGARIFSEYQDTELVFAVPFHLFEELYPALQKIEALQAFELEMKNKVVK